MQQRYNKLPLLFLAILMAGTSLAGCKKKDMSLKLNEPRNIKGVISYRRTFGDLNEAHLNVAQAIGITPIASRKEAEHMKEKLQHIETNDLYVVDSLTAKGLNPNKIIVTSVLRTEDDVKRLRRRNGNASVNSAHFYGTTFDVSWKRFKKVEDEDGRPLQDVSSDTLKLVLSEVLRDLRKADKCYIKYELKQGCFHITTRGK